MFGIQVARIAAEEEPGIGGERECDEDRDDVLAERPAPVHQQQSDTADVHEAHRQVESADQTDEVHVIVIIALFCLLCRADTGCQTILHLETELRMQSENGIKQWFYSIPTFTRTYLVILLLTGFGSSYGLVDPFNLIFSRELIFKRLQVPCGEIPEL